MARNPSGDMQEVKCDASGNLMVTPSVSVVLLSNIQTATAGQTVFTVTGFTFTAYSLCFVGGQLQTLGTEYTITGINEVTFATGITLGDTVTFVGVG